MEHSYREIDRGLSSELNHFAKMRYTAPNRERKPPSDFFFFLYIALSTAPGDLSRARHTRRNPITAGIEPFLFFNTASIPFLRNEVEGWLKCRFEEIRERGGVITRPSAATTNGTSKRLGTYFFTCISGERIKSNTVMISSRFAEEICLETVAQCTMPL